MNAGVAVAIGLFLLSRNSAASSSSGARPGSTAGNARQGSASKSGGSGGGSGFPSPFGAGAGRGGSSDMGDVIDFTDVVNQGSIFPSSSASDAELAPPDFSGVGSGVDESSLTDLANAGLATADNPGVIFDPGNSSDFGFANDPGIDSGDFSGDMAEF